MSTVEQDRLAALRSYRVLDTDSEAAFDRVVQLAADLFEAPIAAISLIDAQRQWFKAKVGLDSSETPRDWAFCNHTIQQADGMLVVEDAVADARFRDNPLVTGSPHIRFYAGAVLTGESGHNLGALCVIDTKPSRPSQAMLAQLRMLARVAVGKLELLRARAVIAEKNRLLDMAEHISGFGHWRWDVGSGRMKWSDEVFRIFGLSPESYDPAFESSLCFYHPDDQPKIRASIAHAIATGQGYQAERRLTRRDGASRIVTTKAVCETNSSGKTTAVVGVFQDITEHRNALDAAKTAISVKAEFLANMSHELRTPLTGIIGFAELLGGQPELSAKSAEYLERVVNGSHALLATVNDVLDFSKLEAGRVELRPRPTPTRPCFSKVLDLFTLQADAKGIGLELDISPSVPAAVIVDPDRLRQILLNLIGNAVKFTARGKVSIQADYELPQTLHITVTDTGSGISAVQLERLFQRFSQVDGSLSRAHGGTGLGLAICKGLVEAMEGKIGVDSTLDLGSTFRVVIPCAAVEIAHQPVHQGGQTIPLDAYRILAVDDNAANRALVSAALKPTGVELTMASGGKEAAQIASQAPFDLILLDIHMPGVDGHDVLGMIRHGAGPNRNVPIVAFTADACGSDSDALREGGFDGVISKPILPSELVRVITAALSEDQESPSAMRKKQVRHA